MSAQSLAQPRGYQLAFIGSQMDAATLVNEAADEFELTILHAEVDRYIGAVGRE